MDSQHSRLHWLTRRAFMGATASAALGAYGVLGGLAAEPPDIFDGKSVLTPLVGAGAMRNRNIPWVPQPAFLALNAMSGVASPP
jgi:hypothetical protein